MSGFGSGSSRKVRLISDISGSGRILKIAIRYIPNSYVIAIIIIIIVTIVNIFNVA